MKTLTKISRQLKDFPADPDTRILKDLAMALCMRQSFKLTELYELGYPNFKLALALLDDWRLGRYTSVKQLAKALDGGGEMEDASVVANPEGHFHS